MRRFDLYGSRELDLAAAADVVARAVDAAAELHDSGYHGGDYYRITGHQGWEILVQENFEDEEGYLAEPDFPDHLVLVYVNGAGDESSGRVSQVDGLEMLRSDEV